MTPRARTLATFAALSLALNGACVDETGPETPLPSFRAVTFNTGTTEGIAGDAGDEPAANGGYGPAQGAYSEEHYGNGLAWAAAVDDVRAFFDEQAPDVVAFQEIFASHECANIPAEARAGFICESWSPGDPTVAQLVLGEGYAVACNLGKPDKCLGVKKTFARIRGCDGDLCLDGLDGGRVDGCGSGSRIGRATLDLVEGGSITVVGVHGTSGMATDDMDCRVRQFQQIFVDLLDGSEAPAANGAANVVLGDFNTDPARLVGADPSADELNVHVSFETPFDFVSPVGKDVQATYSGLVNIDHVIADAWTGSCVAAGLAPGTTPVSPVRYFDHHPLVCDLQPR